MKMAHEPSQPADPASAEGGNQKHDRSWAPSALYRYISTHPGPQIEVWGIRIIVLLPYL